MLHADDHVIACFVTAPIPSPYGAAAEVERYTLHRTWRTAARTASIRVNFLTDRRTRTHVIPAVDALPSYMRELPVRIPPYRSSGHSILFEYGLPNTSSSVWRG